MGLGNRTARQHVSARLDPEQAALDALGALTVDADLDAHLASEDYPELTEILVVKPPPVIYRAAAKTAMPTSPGGTNYWKTSPASAEGVEYEGDYRGTWIRVTRLTDLGDEGARHDKQPTVTRWDGWIRQGTQWAAVAEEYKSLRDAVAELERYIDRQIEGGKQASVHTADWEITDAQGKTLSGGFTDARDAKDEAARLKLDTGGETFVNEVSEHDVAFPGWGSAGADPLPTADSYSGIGMGESLASKQAGIGGWITEQFVGEPHPGDLLPSYDWCRFRRNSHCFLPKELDYDASKTAGYAVWIPTDRGLCTRGTWDAQQGCPVGMPGPNSGADPSYLDATVAWEDGGQHVSIRTSSDLFGDDEAIRPEARISVAAWIDVQAKAKRIRSEGGVYIANIADDHVSAMVKGGSGVYATQLIMAGHSVAMWECGCPWFTYSFDRTRQWRKFEGRMCAHALALSYEIQARGMFGAEVDVNRDPRPSWAGHPEQPLWGQHPYPSPGDYAVTLPKAAELHHEPGCPTKPSGKLYHGSQADLPIGTILVPSDDVPGMDGWSAQMGNYYMNEAVVWMDENPEVAYDFAGGGSYGTSDGWIYTVEPIGTCVNDYDYHGRWVAKKARIVAKQPVKGKPAWPGSYDAAVALSEQHLKDWRSSFTAADHSQDCCITIEPADAERSALAVTNGERAEELHVTLAYLGKTADFDQAQILRALRDVAASHGPLAGQVQGAGWFGDPDDLTIALVDIDGLAALRHDLVSALLLAEVPFSDSHDYTPHLTLAYGPVDAEDKVGLPITANAVVLRWGDEIISVPFASAKTAAAKTGSIEAKVRGALVKIRALLPGHQVKLDNDEVVPVAQVVYPQWSARAGLGYSGPGSVHPSDSPAGISFSGAKLDADGNMDPKRAYQLGWNASARPGHDLERDEARFLRTHTETDWHNWCEGWEDYGCGSPHKYEPNKYLSSKTTVLHDDPEPALPVAYGAEEPDDELTATAAVAKHHHHHDLTGPTNTDPDAAYKTLPGKEILKDAPAIFGDDDDHHEAKTAGLSWLMADVPATVETPGMGDGDIAAQARTFLAKCAARVFSPQEKKQIIAEGEGSFAHNLDLLDLADTHYPQLSLGHDSDASWLA